MRFVLAGSAVTMPRTGAEAARYNVALGYLEAYVAPRLQGVDFRRMEFPITLDDPSFRVGTVDRLLANDPEAIGISSYCWDIDAWTDVLEEVRRRSPTTKIILGGPTATFGGREILATTDLVDIAVLGEGEETLVDLLSRRLSSLDQVPGIFWKERGLVREAAPRALLDLTNIASPYLSGVLEPPRHNLMLECSRGCFFRCKYCAWKNFLGALRHVPEDALRREVEWACERKYEHIFILDSAINFDPERLAGIAKIMRLSGERGGPKFSYFVSHEHLRDSHFEALAGVPTHEVYVGLESIGRAALKGIGRPAVDLEVFEKKLAALASIGPIVISVILGIPGDTFEGFRRTIDYLAALKQRPVGRGIRAVRVFWMIVPPGTYFWENRERFGIRTASRGAPYVLGSQSFPTTDIEGAFRWLLSHPSRELFLYEDASPVPHLPGLKDLPMTTHRGGIERPNAAAFAMDDVRAMLGRVAPGVALPGGWRVIDSLVSEGHPAIRIARGNRELMVQIRPRTEGGAFFVRTRTADLLWLGRKDSSGAIDAAEEAVVRLVANEIARVETSRDSR